MAWLGVHYCVSVLPEILVLHSSELFFSPGLLGVFFLNFRTDVPKENSPPTVYYSRLQIVTATFTFDKDVLIANTFGEIRVSEK